MATATVFRINKLSDSFTRISNKIFKDRRLSNNSLGLLCKILSLPDDWDYSIHGLVAICKEGERSIKNSLKELKEYGYLTVEKTHNDKGRYRYIYTIYEEPTDISTRGTKPHCGYDNVEMRHNKLNKINYLNNICDEQKIEKEQLEEKSERFFKPTAEEVENYAKEIEYNLNGQSFIDYYESKGWMIGKSKMKDWQAAVRTWKRNDFKCNQKNFSSSPSRSAKPLSDYPEFLYKDDGKLKELNEMSIEELKVYYEISDKRISGN